MRILSHMTIVVTSDDIEKRKKLTGLDTSFQDLACSAVSDNLIKHRNPRIVTVHEYFDNKLIGGFQHCSSLTLSVYFEEDIGGQ